MLKLSVSDGPPPKLEVCRNFLLTKLSPDEIPPPPGMCGAACSVLLCCALQVLGGDDGRSGAGGLPWHRQRRPNSAETRNRP